MIPVTRLSRFFLLVSSLSSFVAYAAPARADVVYTFIKMTCDPSVQTATIRAFYELNEAGQARSSKTEKDIYPLGERAGTTTTKQGLCDLGEGRAITFLARQGALPGGDDVQLSFDGMAAAPATREDQGLLYGLSNGPWTLKAKALAGGEYVLTFCPESAAGLRIPTGQERVQLEQQHQNKCERVHVHKGVVWGTPELIDGAATNQQVH